MREEIISLITEMGIELAKHDSVKSMEFIQKAMEINAEIFLEHSIKNSIAINHLTLNTECIK